MALRYRSVFTKTESPASLDRIAKSSRPPAVKFALANRWAHQGVPRLVSVSCSTTSRSFMITIMKRIEHQRTSNAGETPVTTRITSLRPWSAKDGSSCRCHGDDCARFAQEWFRWVAAQKRNGFQFGWAWSGEKLAARRGRHNQDRRGRSSARSDAVKQVSGRELAQIVQRRGWILARVHGSHHVFTMPYRRERIVIPSTAISRW